MIMTSVGQVVSSTKRHTAIQTHLHRFEKIIFPQFDWVLHRANHSPEASDRRAGGESQETTMIGNNDPSGAADLKWCVSACFFQPE